eukprot:gb/GEZN01000287.1/.p1 GENE.gb/GEZN01000287.1/~~gb/GEZN01000287.1/.p1  ORF type:complete len:1678 (+),score=485.33 gb/GEZN01000287.1/:676-5034(+)
MCEDFGKEFRSSQSIVRAFSAVALREGDLVRQLGMLSCQFKVEETALTGYDFRVRNLATDLRDGIRLARLTELLLTRHQGTQRKRKNVSIMSYLRVPAESEADCISNLKIVLEALAKAAPNPGQAHILKSSFSPEHLALGSQLQTLNLLTTMVLQWDAILLLDQYMILSEIRRLKRTHKALQIPCSPLEQGINYVSSDKLQALLNWVQTVCWIQANKMEPALHAENFTTCFSDGRILCSLLSFYRPSLLPLEEIDMLVEDDLPSWAEAQLATSRSGWVMAGSMNGPLPPSKRDLAIQSNFSLLRRATSALGGLPFLLDSLSVADSPRDEKVVLVFVTYLCHRLLQDTPSQHLTLQEEEAALLQEELRLQEEEELLLKQQQAAEEEEKRLWEEEHRQRLLEEQEAIDREEAEKRARAEIQRRNDAALVLQKFTRGWLARLLYADIKEAAEQQRLEEERKLAAAAAEQQRLQQQRKMEEERKRLAMEREREVVRLQKLQAEREEEEKRRREAEAKRKVEEEEERIRARQKAAICLQQFMRTRWKRLAEEEEEEERLYQLELEELAASQRLAAQKARQLKAAIVLQKFTRGWLARLLYSDMQEEARQEAKKKEIARQAAIEQERLRLLKVKQEQEEAQRKKAEEERLRRLAEEAERKRREEEIARQKALEEEARLKEARRKAELLLANRKAAAITLQRFMRRRWQLQAEEEERLYQQELQELAAAAALRAKREKAAVVLQKHTRAFLARLVVADMREEAREARLLAEQRERERHAAEEEAKRLQKLKQEQEEADRRKAEEEEAARQEQERKRKERQRREQEELEAREREKQRLLQLQLQAQEQEKKRILKLQKDREEAVKKIQAVVRTSLARQELKVLVVAEAARKQREKEKAVKALQQWIRKVKARRQLKQAFDKRQHARVLMQSVARGWLARRTVQTLKLEMQRQRQEEEKAMEALAEERRKVRAAIIIQRTVRDWFDRLAIAEEEKTARLQAEQEEAERQRIEAEEAAERQRVAAEKEAERQRVAAEKEAERQRVAAEKEAERQRVEAEEEAERQRVEAEEEEAERQRVAAEKEAERQRVAAEEEAEKQRIAAKEEAERKRVLAEEQERKRKQEEQERLVRQAAEAEAARQQAEREAVEAAERQRVARELAHQQKLLQEERDKQAKIDKSILTIQATWRGHVVRKSISKQQQEKLSEIRKRMEITKKAYKTSDSLGARTQTALEQLLGSRHLSVVFEAIRTLDHVTSVLPSCCVAASEQHAISAIYAVLRSCNRSKPHLELVSLCLSGLLNIASYGPTKDAVFDPDFCLETLTERLQVYRDKPDLFAQILDLLDIGCSVSGFIAQLASRPRVIKRLQGIRNVTEHKLRIETRRKAPLERKKPAAKEGVPSVSADWWQRSLQRQLLLQNKASKPKKEDTMKKLVAEQQGIAQLGYCMLQLDELLARVRSVTEQ